MGRRSVGSFEAKEKLITCPYCRQGSSNIIKASNYGKDKRKLRWKCTNCDKTFSDTWGLPTYREKKTEERRRAWELLGQQGWSIRKIAKELNVSKNTVSHWMREIHPKKTTRRDKIREAKKLRSEGWTIYRIARRYNVCINTVRYQWLGEPKGCLKWGMIFP